MHYIEDFTKYETYLTEEEIVVLKRFIEKIKNNLLVEGVYITPIHYEENYLFDEFDKYIIYIKIIINDTPSYNLMTYKEELPNKEHNLKRINYIIEDFNYQMNMINNKLNNYEVSSHINNSIDYKFESDNTLNNLLNIRLVSSYIIFDRYNYYNNLQERLSENGLMPYIEFSKITNIDDLNKSFVKRK